VKVKFRRQQPPKPVSAESTAKARLRNVGNGTLEVVGNATKFYVEKGRLRKQKEIAKEIPLTDIDSVEQVENELSITWKGVTDRFVIEKAELAKTMYAKIAEALDVQRKLLEAKEAPKQKANELAQALSNAIKIADSLFDILRSLHGRVDWNRVETHLKRSKETIRSFIDQKDAANLDFAKLSSAIKEHLPEEISKEAYGILKALFDYFNGLTSQSEALAQIHPNNDAAKKVILAYYTLNDIILGIVVEDEEVRKESNELVVALDDLSKITGLKIDIAAVKEAINKLGVEKDRESVIEESRALFVQQLKELIAA
jgi:hypothetical protein